MSNYKKMYIALVDEVDKTIENLKKALNKAEDIYIETEINEDKPKIIKLEKRDD